MKKINITHNLGPNISKSSSLNLTHQGLSNNIKSVSQTSFKKKFNLNEFLNIQYSITSPP